MRGRVDPIDHSELLSTICFAEKSVAECAELDDITVSQVETILRERLLKGY